MGVLTTRRSFGVVGLLTRAIPIVFGPRAHSQSQEHSPAFDVVSIRPSTGGPVKIDSDPIRISIKGQAVDVLIRLAFGLREYQYRGPYWLHTTRYDILATCPSPQSRPAQLIMLRNLLMDRFKLQLHRESKNVAVYALVLGPEGPKLRPVDKTMPVPFELYSNFSIVPAPGDTSELRGVGTMGQFCDFLTRVADRPVIDRTGLPSAFDIRLRCAIDGYPGEDTSPSVFDAVRMQLGLKMEGQTAPIEITVIDHVEKPAGN
jgi:uncharacterized protein (TIGR03435 family)